MLAAYVAFLIGSSSKLPAQLIIFVPACCVIGYLLDRVPAVQQMLVTQPRQIYRVVAINYLLFLPVSGVFFGLGYAFDLWQSS